MSGIIISMPKYEDANRIGDIIRRSGMGVEPLICTRGGETLRMVEDREINIVICSKRLPDMGYEEISDYLPGSVNMILLTQDASIVPYSSNIVRILLPFRAGDLINTINMLNPYGSYKPKKKRAPRSLEEQKLIDKAKQILMGRNSMEEAEAFRYIQKSSMDSGRSMVESAQMILMMNCD